MNVVAVPDVAVVAGEASGDVLASIVLRGWRRVHPQVQAAGIGGPQMQAQGFDAWWPSSHLAVRGYVEVLRHYRRIVGIRNQLRQRLLSQPPRLFLGVDAPDFNLALERDLRNHGIPTVHFVCPSVWAWRPERIGALRDSTDHVLCIFPFEPALLRQHGIAATYVGHPLAPTIPMEPDRWAARHALGLPQEATVIALLPGSRSSEIQYIAQRFFDAARLILKEKPTTKFILPMAPGQEMALQAWAESSGLGSALHMVAGQSHPALAACDVTLIASGTATLEAALFKRPMVIAYNMHWLSWQIMKRKRLQAWVGLPNILCQDFVVPELLQDQATPAALAAEALAWLAQPQRVARMEQRFRALHEELTRDTVGLTLSVLTQYIAPMPGDAQ
jgi:lipid-A-disaccharide synthase